MMEKTKSRLGVKDFEKAFGDRFEPRLKSIIGGYNFSYSEVTLEEREYWMGKIKEALKSPIVEAGEHRLEQWEHGWSENFDSLDKNKNAAALIPRYFGKYKVVRWKQDFITPRSNNFEYNMLAVIEDWLFHKYMKSVKSIYEFGAGTGHNFMRARRANEVAKLYGLDWTKSSGEVINRAVELGLLSDSEGIRFNLFDPDFSLNLAPASGVYTVASLEQVGNRFQPFIEYLLEKKPEICVHIEPVAELLDKTNPLDQLSIEYFKKRNYLSGFLDHLKGLEKEGKITIHKAQRTYIGSLFIEGYSVIVWSPN